MSAKLVVRNVLEFAALFLLWWACQEAIDRQAAGSAALVGLILALAWAKTLFFGIENITQLRQASDENWAYYRFMLLMMVNMWQIVASFGLDFHLLHRLRPESFAVIADGLAGGEMVFEFFYYSALNFMFFGYGDITPQTVPAKLLTLTEIALAFVTVIFLLSDFISLKESLKRTEESERPANSANRRE